jgi:DNA mismatch repair protein MutL
MPIRILPDTTASQIAAGEVVERPASVVKELVENALDAGAANIVVAIEAGGTRLIRVADDGAGIPSEEVGLAFHRHATSKIASIEDLGRLQTLGFRGEALASIAAVSHVTMVTRHEDEQAGTRLRIDGGRQSGLDSIGAPQGTIVTVEHLFFNVPARLKFLKTEGTERRHIAALITRYAMAYPGVRFTLEHEGQIVFRSSGNGSLRDALTDVYGAETAEFLLPIVADASSDESRDDLPPVGVEGYVSTPSLHRAGRDQMTIFINGRWVQDSHLTYAITQAYHTLLPTGRYPVAVIMVTLPPEEVDVNVHPTKAEVRFRRADAVFTAVQRTVRHTIIDQSPVAPLSESVFWGSPDWEARRERLARVSREYASQLGMDLSDMEPGQHPHQRPRSAEAAPALPMLRVVGQVGAMYIVAEGPDGLYLIDQHAAHERILYEQFMAQREEENAPPSQELLEAAAVELLPEEIALLEEHLAELEAVGFIVEVFGRQAALVRALPALIAEANPTEALRAALSAVSSGEKPAEATAEEQLIARVCKQAAIKAGQILSLEEMQTLTRLLESCESPQTCPHGRPTMLTLTAEQLAKQFGRA